MPSPEDIVLALQALRHPWVDGVMWVPHFLGSPGFYVLSLPLAYLLLGRERGGDFVATMVVGFGLIFALKDGFDLPRPFEVLGFAPLYGVKNVPSPSFPSGHAMGTALFYTAVALMARRRWVGVGGALLGVWVAFSRVYAGVHWPVDVIVGALLGVGWGGFAHWGLGRSFRNHPWGFPMVLGGAMLLLILMSPWSERVWPLVALLAGVGVGAGSIFEPQWMHRHDWRFWFLRAIPGVMITGAVVALGMAWWGRETLPLAITYGLAGVWVGWGMPRFLAVESGRRAVTEPVVPNRVR